MTLSKRAWICRILIVLLVGWLVFVGFIWWAMRQTPERFAGVMAKMPVAAYFVLPFETMWTKARAGTLQAGDVAPDFTLTKLDKSDKVHLAALASQKPVVLVFGSYT